MAKIRLFLVLLLLVSHISVIYSQIVFEQTGGVIPLGIASQDFEFANNGYDCEAADDFVVPAGLNWTIDSIEIFGQYSNLSDSMGFRFRLYEDNNTNPGAILLEREWLSGADPDGDANVTIRFDCPLTIPSGRYWIGAQAIKPLIGGGQWYWLRDSIGAHEVFRWKNPQGGFGTSCFSFTPVNICATTITEPGVAFIVYGCQGGPSLDVLPDDTIVCANSDFVLSPDTGIGGSNLYNWNTGDSTPQLIVDSTREYRVSVTDTTTNCYTVRCGDIEVIHIPDPGLFDDTICEVGGPTSGAFFASSCDNCVNIWNGSDTNNALFGYSDEGVITKMVLDTVIGCFEIDTAQIDVQVVDMGIFPSNDTSICYGDSVDLYANPGFASYLWYEYTNPGWQIIHDSNGLSVDEDGTFRLIVSTEIGCQGFDTASVTVNSNPYPVIQSIWVGDTIVLFTSKGYSEYLWSSGATDSAFVPDSNGVYTVTVTDSNGCVGQDEISVIHVGGGSQASPIFRVFPNPTENFIWVEGVQHHQGGRIEVIDHFGRKLNESRITGPSVHLDLSSIPSGHYTILLVDRGVVSATSIVLNH